MILKLAQHKRPKKPEGAIHLGLTDPLWETVEACWKTRPLDRLTVTQVLESWEKEINDTGLPAVERGESLDAGERGELSLTLRLHQTERSSFRQSLSLVEMPMWWISGSVCRMTAQVPRNPISGLDVVVREILSRRATHLASMRM